METVPFLRDVDDEKHYAQLLEVAYVEAYCELDKILQASKFDHKHPSRGKSDGSTLHVSQEDLTRLRFVMDCTVEQSVDRRRRLANVARRLADVVLDTEGSEE